MKKYTHFTEQVEYYIQKTNWFDVVIIVAVGIGLAIAIGELLLW